MKDKFQLSSTEMFERECPFCKKHIIVTAKVRRYVDSVKIEKKGVI